MNSPAPGMGAVIGRSGETLDAIQHPTNYAINRGGEKRCHINVDAESYRAQARGEPCPPGGEDGRQGREVQAAWRWSP